MNTIGIIGAMDIEVNELIGKLSDSKTIQKASMTFYDGMLHGTHVVIVRCGVGKVNAGICAQLLVDLFDVTHVINTGIAGSLNAALDIGDIVISDDALYHDMAAGAFGYEPGQVPSMDTFSFKADETMIAKAKASCEKVNPDIHAVVGRIVTGDQFVADKATKERIVTLFNGFCTEMEGCAIAHACYLNKIPFVIIRAISDKADDSASMDYPAFEKQAANHSAALVEDLIQAI